MQVNYSEQSSYDWNSIETITPDCWDKEMLNDIVADPDSDVFISAEYVMSELGIKAVSEPMNDNINL